MRNIADEVGIGLDTGESVVSGECSHRMHHDVMVAGKEILKRRSYAISVRTDDLDFHRSAGALVDP